MKRTVPGMLEQATDSFAHVPYVWKKTDEGWSSLTFAEVQDDARSVAAYLLSRGLEKENTVAVLCEGRPEWVVCEFATLYAGGISVPLSIKLLAEEVPYRLNHSESSFIVVSRNTVEKVVSILDSVESDIQLLYVDEDLEPVRNAAKRYRVNIEERVHRYSDILAEGRRLRSEFQERLSHIEEQTGEDDVVTISYTSGTTGNPKGIMLTHLNYYANCSDAVEVFNVPFGFKTLLILPCDHSFAHTVGLYAALLRGIELYFVDARGGGLATLRNIPVNLKETNPTFLLTVPALTGNFMKKIADGVREKGRLLDWLFRSGITAGIRFHGDGYRKPPFPVRFFNWFGYRIADMLIFGKVRQIFGTGIRFCVGGGALLDVGQQEFFKAVGVPIFQGYGLTEAAPVISSNTPAVHKLGTSGKVFPGIECRILCDDGREVAPGETGQIAVRGLNVMKGYFKNEEETNRTIIDGWLMTGDRGYLDEDGFLVVVGREKALLISSDGEKYSPEEIEEAIVNSSSLISQVVAYNDHRRYTTALVTLDDDVVRRRISEGTISSAAALLNQIQSDLHAFKKEPAHRGRFPEQWIPSTFQVLAEPFSEENQMVNSTMKLVRYRIFQTYEARIERMYAADGHDPQNEENLNELRSRFGLS